MDTTIATASQIQDRTENNNRHILERADAELARPTHSDADIAAMHAELDTTRTTNRSLRSKLAGYEASNYILISIDRVWGLNLGAWLGWSNIVARADSTAAEALATIAGTYPTLKRTALIELERLGYEIWACGGLAGSPERISPADDRWDDLE